MTVILRWLSSAAFAKTLNSMERATSAKEGRTQPQPNPILMRRWFSGRWTHGAMWADPLLPIGPAKSSDNETSVSSITPHIPGAGNS